MSADIFIGYGAKVGTLGRDVELEIKHDELEVIKHELRDSIVQPKLVGMYPERNLRHNTSLLLVHRDSIMTQTGSFGDTVSFDIPDLWTPNDDDRFRKRISAIAEEYFEVELADPDLTYHAWMLD